MSDPLHTYHKENIEIKIINGHEWLDAYGRDNMTHEKEEKDIHEWILKKLYDARIKIAFYGNNFDFLCLKLELN